MYRPLDLLILGAVLGAAVMQFVLEHERRQRERSDRLSDLEHEVAELLNRPEASEAPAAAAA